MGWNLPLATIHRKQGDAGKKSPLKGGASSMLFLRLWNYLRGYVIIIVEGNFIEKFLNICTHRQIRLWDVRMQKEHLATMKLGIKSFRSIRPIVRKARCRVKLVNKIGLPFVLNRYRRRKAFYAGVVLFIVLIYVTTSFIWSVEIKGNNKIPASRIEEALERHGVKTGILKYGINTDKAVTGLMLEMKELSWLSIVVKGTKVKVDLRERIEIPEIIPKDMPCDIVASKEGLIKQILVMEGIESVGVGDTVKKGHILISGRIPAKDDEDKFRQVHAMGTVTARTWYEEREPVKLTEVERVKTGRYITNYSMKLFSWNLDLIPLKNKFSDYDVEERRRKLSIGENLVFPIEWITVKYYEEKPVEAHVNEDDARAKAAETAYMKLLRQLPSGAEVVGKKEKFSIEENGEQAAIVILECIENIGMSRRIGGN